MLDMEDAIRPGAKLQDCMRHNAVRGGVFCTADAEFSCVWPPVASAGQPTSVEAVLSISQTSNLSPSSLPGSPAQRGSSLGAAEAEAAGKAAMEHALSTQLGGGASQAALLTVQHDTILGVDEFKLPVRGETTARCRVYEREVHCINLVAGCQPGGWPSVCALQSSVVLPVLPHHARQEMQMVVWHMMCEYFPPSHSVPEYDQEAFDSPFSRLPHNLQVAYAWAWSNHFRSLAQDLDYCLTGPTARGPELEAEYRDALTNMVGYLRDQDCYSTLACLLAAAARNGVVLLAEDGAPLSPCDLSTERVAAMSADAQQLACEAVEAEAANTFATAEAAALLSLADGSTLCSQCTSTRGMCSSCREGEADAGTTEQEVEPVSAAAEMAASVSSRDRVTAVLAVAALLCGLAAVAGLVLMASTVRPALAPTGPTGAWVCWSPLPLLLQLLPLLAVAAGMSVLLPKAYAAPAAVPSIGK